MTLIHEVLRRPLVTEKSSRQSGRLSQYSFEVAPNATRTMVKDAVETMFDVQVASVNILNTPAKRGRRAKSRRLLVRKSGFKKAIVTLAEGSRIDVSTGI